VARANATLDGSHQLGGAVVFDLAGTSDTRRPDVKRFGRVSL